MTDKIEYGQLAVGFDFSPSIFTMEANMVSLYLKATEDNNVIYQEKVVPPMAVVALAMAALAEKFVLLPGTVHVSQQLEFAKTVLVNETLTSYARVNRKVVRGKFHMLNIGLKVVNQQMEPVVVGEVGFILPIS
jgi:acyl dehydratase